jgi:hypothetical protein
MSEDIDMKSYGGEAPQAPSQAQTTYDDNEIRGLHEESLTHTQQPVEQVQTYQQAEEPTKQEFNFRALSGEVERIKSEREAERREYQLQLELMRANMTPRQQEAPAPQERKMFDGLDDLDTPTTSQIRQEWSERESQYQNTLNRYEGTIQEMQVALNNPDYLEVVTKYATPFIKDNPIFAQGAQGAENKALYVYQLGKMAQRMNQPQPQQQAVHPNAQKIVDNARKPGNVAVTGGQSTLSQADYIATMSDNDFMKYASKHLEGI